MTNRVSILPAFGGFILGEKGSSEWILSKTWEIYNFDIICCIGIFKGFKAT